MRRRTVPLRAERILRVAVGLDDVFEGRAPEPGGAGRKLRAHG